MKFINQAEFVLLTLISAFISLRIDSEIMSFKTCGYATLVNWNFFLS